MTTLPNNLTIQTLAALPDEEIEALDLSEDVLDAIDFERYLSRATKEGERFSSWLLIHL